MILGKNDLFRLAGTVAAPGAIAHRGAEKSKSESENTPKGSSLRDQAEPHKFV